MTTEKSDLRTDEALLAEAFPRSPAEQAAWSWEQLTEYSPLIRNAPKEVGAGWKRTTIFGGELMVDIALLRYHGTQIAEMHTAMKLKALMLYFESSCVHGDKNWKPLTLKKVAPDCRWASIGTASDCEYQLHRYNDMGGKVLPPNKDKNQSRWKRWTPRALPFCFEFTTCERLANEYYPVHGWRIEWNLWRAPQ